MLGCDLTIMKYGICFIRLLKGRSFPGKVLLTRKPDPPNQFSPTKHPSDIESSSEIDIGRGESSDNFDEVM